MPKETKMKLLNWCDSHALLVVFALIALMMLPVVVEGSL